MKNLIPYLTLITTLFTGTLAASNQFDEYEKVHIHQLKAKQPNTIKLKMNYAGNTFVSKSNMNALQNNEILQVDLVYTSFKRDANFDQLALNKKRITQLKKEHSIFSNKNIKWQFIEQEGATDFKEAKDYFHGFVVHFGKSLNYKTLSNSYSGIQKEFNAYPMNNSGGILHYNSGTKIKILPNSVTYEDGTPVKGEFEIKYREFRNAAEIAFSGIPMTFNGQNFNSVGMYEIRGEQNGKTLKLTQPAVVNFQCTKGDSGIGFYHLDESSSKWEKVKQITKNKAENIEIKKEIQLDSPIGSYRIVGGTVKSDNGNYIPVPVNHNKTWISSEMLAEKKEKITFGDYSWGCYNKVLDQIGDSIIEIQRDEKKQEVVYQLTVFS